MTTKADKIKKIIKKNRQFTIQNNGFCFLDGDRMPSKTAGTGFLSKVQELIKSNGKLYYLIICILGPILYNFKFYRRFKSLLKKYDQDAVILNIGCGPQPVSNREDIINVDLFAFDIADIIADADDLPLIDNSVDFIINIAMMEHVPNPEKVLNEAYRVLKPGGELIAYLPFIQPFHAAPHDFTRWTRSGIQQLFSRFSTSNIQIGGGPTSGMLWIFQEWLAIFFSFGSRMIHDILLIILMILTAPVKLADLLLVQFPNAEKIASGFVITGKK